MGALTEWKSAYKRGFAMQAPLVLVGFLLGLLAWWQTKDWRRPLGAVVLAANWPYTFFAIMPTNSQLKAINSADAGSTSRMLVEKWGRLARGALCARLCRHARFPLGVDELSLFKVHELHDALSEEVAGSGCAREG